MDCPKEFRSPRDGIAEKLFSVRVSMCFGCNNVELLVHDAGEDLRDDEDYVSVKWELIEKRSNMDIGNGSEQDEIPRACLSNYNNDDVEALTKVMYDENQINITGEVLRIKKVLLHSHDQSEAVLYEFLRRLQIMQLSIETLKTVEIGRQVNDLRKHHSKRISRLARTLIEGWKEIVDEWYLTAAAIPEHNPNLVDPSLLAVADDLPTPPMDERTLLSVQSTSIQLSERSLLGTMEGKSGSVDYWRRFFRRKEANIFEVIEKAIVVTTMDCPKEFRSRRDGIAEKLFSVRVSMCFGCNNVELLVPDVGEDLRDDEDGGSVKWELIEKGSNMDSRNGSEQDELTRTCLSNYNNDDAEALTEVMYEENQINITREVLGIKEVLLHSHEQFEAVLYESLRRLQMMQLSIETLKAVEIGRQVNNLRKHNSKRIDRLARTLIEGWKKILDEWFLTAAAIHDVEDGLHTPPMDERFLLAIQSTSIQLSDINLGDL